MNGRVPFSQLLGRADDETLAELIGRPVVRLLHALDPQLARPSRLRELILELHEPVELLRRRATRNTLLNLLRREEAEALATEVNGGTAEDAYISLMKLRPRRGSRPESAFLDYFGVAAEHGAAYSVELPPSCHEVQPDYALFDHQRMALARLGTLLAKPPYRAMLHMPTGSGKTRTAMSLIVDELRRTEPSVVVWLAYSEELCEQTAIEFEKAWQRLGNRPISVQRYWGAHEGKTSDTRDGFLVASLGKMYAAVKRNYASWAQLADKTSLVIIDEAHQAIAQTYREVLELLAERHEGTRLLGLTATPGRTWSDIEADERLSRFFGTNKATLDVKGYGSPVDYLVEEGYLARTQFVPLSHAGPELTDDDRQELADSLDISSRLLEQLAMDEQRNLMIVERIEGLARTHARIIVFAATVYHAEMLAVILRARGFEADAVTSHTPRNERERIIRGFKGDGDDVRILCNYGVLTTGFDAPRTSAALIARPTKSLVLYSQMVGRAIRGPRVGGNPQAEVMTVVDTGLPGFGDVADAFFNWEDVWND